MSDGSRSRCEYSKEVGGDESPNIGFHGVAICIGTDVYDRVTHRKQFNHAAIPSVISYSDGIVVGCSFITNSALERIYELHKSFLTNQYNKVHQ